MNVLQQCAFNVQGCECFYDEDENMHCELKENSNPIPVSCSKAGGIVALVFKRRKHGDS